MRNLELLTVTEVCLDISDPTVYLVLHGDTGQIFTITNTSILLVDPQERCVVDRVSLLEEGYLTSDGLLHVINAVHLADQQALCVAISDGNIICWNYTIHEIECVGCVEGGLTSMTWSPDQEILVLTTGNETLLLMSREFEPITETALHQSTFGEAALVNVGWGKKETQFHGSIGKEAAKHTDQKTVAAVEGWDDRVARVSWRGDGQYFTVSSISPQSGCREIRVWSRDGSLISTCESVPGLEYSLAWKPSGSLIASSQRSENKHQVIFFERNGLRHGEFNMTFGKDTVKVCEIAWNLDSTILTVWCEDLPPEGAPSSYLPSSHVQLWTCGNYHWYLKQCLHFKPTNGIRVVSVVWDLEHAYRLHILSSGGQYLQYTWCWTTNHSLGMTSSDQAVVAVIDKDTLLVTPMKSLVVPPPMSAYNLQLPSPVNQVLFAPPPFTNDIAALLSDGRLTIISYREGHRDLIEDVCASGAGGQGFSLSCDLPLHIDIYRIAGMPEYCTSFPLALHHVTQVTSDSFVMFGLNPKRNNSILYHVELRRQETTELMLTSTVEVEGHVLTTATAPSGGSLTLQLTDGTLLKYDPVSGVICPWESSSGEEVRFPQPCTQIQVSEIGGEEVVLGLTDRFRFYVNNIELSSNCTSFAIHESYLLLTTLTHTCRCIARNTQLNALSILSDGKSHPFDESVRRVERGSRIVAVVPDDTKLVLQMPRGNLETIHPRALVLSAVRSALERLEYGTAFGIMKKHRINMNLLYDHNPESFITNIQKCLTQINSVTDINIFLTELQEEDVTMTMYTAAYQERPSIDHSDPKDSQENKVDIICKAVKKALIDINENHYLLSILTTYVKNSSPELEAALQLIKTLRDEPVTKGKVSAEEALKYLLFLVDVNELYNVALGTYDFNLIVMVAEKSQKDPKEYLPFLNRLRRLEENYQKYNIDKELKRYEKALRNIAKCDDKFNECLSLVKDHKLYRTAMTLFVPTSQQYKDIAVSFGEYLEEKKYDEEAGFMFVKAEEWSLALKCFEKSLNWRQTLCMAAILDYSAEDTVDLSKKLAGCLKDVQDFSSSALILELYVKDVEEAIVTLIEGQVWEESLRLMYVYKRTDFIETNLKSALLERYNEYMVDFDRTLTDFERHKKRLAIVRREKKERLEFIESGTNYNAVDSDLFSDASSVAGESVVSSHLSTSSQRSSLNSRSTGRSSRNRRKLERKKWSLKEGSSHEELALVEALSKLISFTDNLRGEVTPLMKMLTQFFHDTEASELQQKYDQLLKVMERSLPEIWIEDEETSPIKSVFGPTATANSIATAMQAGHRGQAEDKLDPVLRFPPKMSVNKRWKLHMLDS